MNLTKPAGPLDDASAPDGDRAFVGVDERLPAQQLQPGLVASAKNVRFRRGKIEPRDGITVLPWVKGNGLTPFADVLGGAVFQDPNQSGEWILIAANGGVWKTRPNAIAKAVPLPAGVTLARDTFVKFIQANSAIIMLRGLGADPLACYDLEVGFQTIVQENEWEVQMAATVNRVRFAASNVIVGDPVQFTARAVPEFPNPAYTYTLPAGITSGKTYYVLATPNANEFTISATPGGTPVGWNTSPTDAAIYDVNITVLDGAVPIPPAINGIFAQNRLFLIDSKDTVLVSDAGDFTRYQPATNVFRINEGDSFTLNNLALYNEDTMVFFKDGNVMKARGVSGDLSGAVGPLNVTQAYGSAAASAADYGTGLYWLNSELRVVQLDLTSLNQEQANIVPFSDPLVQTFGRINPLYSSRARLATHNGFLYCALPLDDAQIVSMTDSVLNGFDPGETTDTRPRYDIVTGTYVVTGLTVGKVYQYRQGPDQDNGGEDISLINGTEVLGGDADFTAQGATVTVTGSANFFVLASVKEILANGVNTGVAVHDFNVGQWAGSDEAENVVCVVDWLKFTYNQQQVLAFVGADGYLHLYNDGYEDEQVEMVTAPYADILVDRLPANLDILIVTYGNGNSFAALAQTTAPAPGVWACDTLANARATLFTALFGDTSGATAIDYGVRGALGTDPVTVFINGVQVANGNSAWAFVDSHSGSEIRPVAIVTDVVFRAYLCQTADMKRFVACALQLATWAPSYTIYTRTQGQGDETQYAPDPAGGAAGVTRDYTKYFTPFERPDWTVDNRNDDFGEANRQDYAYPETGEGILLGSGVNFDAEQQYVHRVAVQENGVYLQIRLVNADGRVSVLAAGMEAEEGVKASGLELK